LCVFIFKLPLATGDTGLSLIDTSMKKNRLVFYAVFGAFHLFLVIFSIYVESQRNDFAFLTTMLKLISLMKYGAFLGLGLLITDVVWDLMTAKENTKEKDALMHEMNMLKAKLFDLQEAAKSAQQHPVNPNLKS
jgi:hypothetical protein